MALAPDALFCLLRVPCGLCPIPVVLLGDRHLSGCSSSRARRVARSQNPQLFDGRLVYWAGGGITLRSDATKEWQELHLKTQVMGQSLANSFEPWANSYVPYS